MSAFFGRRQQPSPVPEEPGEAALIDQLMAGPIKERPKIIVLGDDDVFGINPAPVKSSNDA